MIGSTNVHFSTVNYPMLGWKCSGNYLTATAEL